MDNFSALFGKKLAGSGGGSGTDNYNELSNKPQINGNSLTGNKTGANLGLQDVITSESKLSSDLIDDTGAENLFVSASDKSAWSGKQDPATTLAGYGITDAYTKSETNTALAAKQDTLTASQQAAVDSGITAEKLTADEAALAEVVDGGAKNKLHYNGISTPSGDTTNISFSCSGDLITITGSTSSNAAWCYLTLDGSIIVANDFCNGKYYLSSERTGRGPVDIFVYESSVGQIADESGNGVVIPNKTTTNAVRIMINIPKGATVNITLKIMICTAADWAISQKFVPYARTNSELTVLMDEDRASLVELVDNGAKNLLKNELGSGTKSGLAYTTRTDGSIVITGGTATGGNADFVIPFTTKESGQYVLQGCPSGGSGETYKGQIVLYPSMTNVAAIFDNTSVTATLTGGTQYAYRFRVYNGKAISDSTIYPMVCSKAAWDISHQYEPYALPNPVITPALIEQVDGGAKNVAQTNDVTKTGNGFVNTDPISGDLIVSAATVSTTASSSTFAVIFYYTDGTISPTQQLPITNSLVHKFNTGEKVVERVQIFADNTTEASSGKTITLTNFMICTAADWAVSQKFVPYCPSLYELYQMIIALQNGTRSAPALALAKAEPEETEPETGDEEMR